MTAIENIINQIENETRRFGNTKTRVAAVLRLIKAKLVELSSGKLDKGRYTGTADDLNNAIGNKVDKIPGKILSSNDFTNELRTKLEGLQNVDISQLLPKGGYTGTAQNLKELIDNIMRILQSPDTELDELREIVAFIKQNKRTLDTLGINNIAGLQDALNGKAPTDHNHDDRYSLLGHTHPEYAPRTHRHNWDDIDGKPALATEGKIQEAIGKIQVGGRNLLLMSKRKISNSDYLIAAYTLTEQLREGEQVTFTIKGQLGAGKSAFSIHNSNGYVYLVTLESKGNGLYQATFNWTLTGYGRTADNTSIKIYTISNTTIANSTIEWVKLERGNIPTDWSPAPEDAPVGLDINGTRQILPDEADKVIFVTNSIDNCALNVFPDRCSVTFRKVFAGGNVTFTCLGKQIIYTGDNAFNGGDGSTAVVSIWNNKCYIDIRNV